MISALANFYSEAEQCANKLAKHIPLEDEEALLQTAEGIYIDIADEAAQTTRLEECSLLQLEGDAGKVASKQTLKGFVTNEYQPFNFAGKAAKRMEQPERIIPLHILDDIIKNPLHVRPDPQRTTNAYMYYARIWKNGKLYNSEVLYESNMNTIFHFVYREESLGPLEKVKNNV